MDCKQSLFAVDCSFEFKNDGDKDYYLLKRNTPLEGLHSPFVAVSIDGAPLLYEGYLFYRTPPKKQDFILLEIGESVTATAQINDIFAFASDDTYNIRYNRPLQILPKENMELESASGEIKSAQKIEVDESVNIQLMNTDLLSRPVNKESEEEGDEVYIESCRSVATYVGGSSSTRKATTKAHKKLCKKYLRARRRVGNNATYRLWFGAYTVRRARKVESVLKRSRNRIAWNRVKYNFRGSECDSDTYAYTCYQCRTVWLCGAYVADPTFCRTSGTSKEGTLAHEWTHVGADTEDYAYGVADSQELARDEPNKAVDNAENFEFYYCRA